jgi:hypothetical protein
MAARRFTLLDAMLLVVAAAFGAWLARLLLISDEIVIAWPTRATWVDWFGASYLVLLGVTLGGAAVRLRPPRPPLRRLARQPGFLAGLAVTANIALGTALTALNWYNTRWIPGRTAAQALSWLHGYLLSIGGPWNVAFAVSLAWIIGGIQGFRWGQADWVERAGRWLGVLWLLYWLFVLGLSVWGR